jgi:protein-tyrosine phosphatase
MTSLLRKLVAGPRAHHPEANLDLCYLTPSLIVTSGPAISFPSTAYRNPLPDLLSFLESRHGDRWKIFEFRAEGTGYKDEEVKGRVEHWKWVDHHPPPFTVLEGVVQSLETWLGDDGKEGNDGKGRAGVLHCKAGKGRSGTVACSYLIAAQGWDMDKAMTRFTERRMRPNWGDGISIASQRRWVSYVSRWAKDGRRYRTGKVRIVEVRVWGMRENVRIAVRQYVDGGMKIEKIEDWGEKDAEVIPLVDDDGLAKDWFLRSQDSPPSSGFATPKSNAYHGEELKSPTSSISSSKAFAALSTPPPRTINIFRPKKAIVLSALDVNIEVEKRNKNITSMVTSTAHSWFNAYFEGNGPENSGVPAPSGIYTVEWDAMDGLKGSTQRGVRSVEKIAVVWKIVDENEAAQVDHEAKQKEAEEPKESKIAAAITELGHKVERDETSDSEAEEGVKSYGIGNEKV